MKIRALFLLLFPICVSAQSKLVVSGKLKGLKDGTPVVLVDVNRPTDTLSRSNAKGGAFELKGELKEPTLVNISFGEGKQLITMLENSNVKMTGDVNQLKTLVVKGSATYTDFDAFQKSFDPLFDKVRKTSQRMQSGDTSDSTVNALNKGIEDIQVETDRFIAARPASPVSAFVMAVTLELKDDIALAEKRFNSLQPAAKENMYAKYLENYINTTKLTAIGSMAADFTQADTSGHPVSLSSFRGKYVLLDFWASWCGPCRVENPNVVANYKKFSAKNFTVLGVSLDRPGQKDKWLAAIHADGLTWTHVSDLQFWQNAVAQQYRIESIPQNLLIGPDGKILAKNLRGSALEAKLCEILGCN